MNTKAALKTLAVSQDRIRALLDYNPETGVFVWIRQPRENFATAQPWKAWNTRFAGKEAGHLTREGYRVIKIPEGLFYAHRLAMLHASNVPLSAYGHIDHINQDRHDNRLANLRLVDCSLNLKNARKPRNNTSGVVGVSFLKALGKWEAYLTSNQKKITLGYFETIEEAAAKRKHANSKYGFHENHGRERAQY